MRVLPADDGATVLDDLELVLELGEAASTVFLARRTGPRQFERWLAVRYVGPFLPEQEALGGLIERDVRHAAAVSHPSVLPIHDVGATGNARYVVTDFVDGGAVSDLLDLCDGKLPVPIVSAIALDVLQGLEAVHGTSHGSQALVHGRVSARNLIVGLDGKTRLADLGLARAPRVDQGGEAHASFQYLAPEAIRGEPLDARADIFSLGVVLHEALGGQHPLAAARSRAEVMSRIGTPLPRLDAAVADVSAALADVVARAVEAEPGARFQDARSFAEALEKATKPASARDVAVFAEVHLRAGADEKRALARAWVDARRRHLGLSDPPRRPLLLAWSWLRRPRVARAVGITLAAASLAALALAARPQAPEAALELGFWPRLGERPPPRPRAPDETAIDVNDLPSVAPLTPRPRPRRRPDDLTNPYR